MNRIAGGNASEPETAPRRTGRWRAVVKKLTTKGTKNAKAEKVVVLLVAVVLGGGAVRSEPGGAGFWAFQRLARPAPPAADDPGSAPTPIDRFVLARLEAEGLRFAPEADRRTVIRRLHLDLFGFPPPPEEADAFAADPHPLAYERLVDRLLASPRFGERWGVEWLDAAGYSDSNGYHRNDTPRPLAFRYRDYVIRALNEDRPYDRFLREQLAGDELAGYHGAPALGADEVDALIATHFLRNAPDGTDSTEGNESVRTIERYAVLEGAEQIIGSALFGLTLDCARCHDHKFDPIPQRDYYALQAVLYPAFNVKEWVQPKERWIHAAGAEEIARWRAASAAVDAEAAALRRGFEAWLASQAAFTAAAGAPVFADCFDGGGLDASWSAAAPGDNAAVAEPDKPARPTVRLEGDEGPAARAAEGRLELIAARGGESVWLSTRRAFDWTPAAVGGWIEASFELAADSVGGSAPAARIGFYIALHDRDDDDGAAPRGNVLLDGDPAGGAAVHLDYPGKDARALGVIGTSGYVPGRRYGVRVVRVGDDEYLLAQVADGRMEERTVTLKAAELPDGGFGFELCCSRSFAADVVEIRQGGDPAAPGAQAFAATLGARRAELRREIAAAQARRPPEPERVALITDLPAPPPSVPLLRRGSYFQPGEAIEPGVLSALAEEPGEPLPAAPLPPGARTTGRRLAFARWATRPGSRAAALLARVEANRIWLGHFGRGLVESAGNFGARGARPSHPELLEWLAAELVDGGWSRKRLHRRILLSRAYRQASAHDARAAAADPEVILLWQYPTRRLDAEALRDSLLAAAGLLRFEMGGPPVPFTAREDGQVILPAAAEGGPPGSDRRSIYIERRRSQPLTFLQAFDLAAMDPNCLARPSSAVVPQALLLLNGELAARAASALAERAAREAPGGGEAEGREEAVARAFAAALARAPAGAERERVAAFLDDQARLHREEGAADADAARLAFRDFCRMLLASNEFAYIP